MEVAEALYMRDADVGEARSLLPGAAPEMSTGRARQRFLAVVNAWFAGQFCAASVSGLAGVAAAQSPAVQNLSAKAAPAVLFFVLSAALLMFAVLYRNSATLNAPLLVLHVTTLSAALFWTFADRDVPERLSGPLVLYFVFCATWFAISAAYHGLVSLVLRIFCGIARLVSLVTVSGVALVQIEVDGWSRMLFASALAAGALFVGFVTLDMKLLSAHVSARDAPLAVITIYMDLLQITCCTAPDGGSQSA